MAGTSFSSNDGNATGVVYADGFAGALNPVGSPVVAGPATFPTGTIAKVATITAFAGGGKANATPITTDMVNVGTVATAGNSVLLPPAVAGKSVTVTNAGANAMQVFGAGTDTINGVATGTGVSQPASSTVVYTAAATGKWTTPSGALTVPASVGGNLLTVTDNITAHAGGGQGSATPLTTQRNRVTTVATTADSVLLPAAVAGLEVWVLNNAATNSLQMFGTGTNTINGAAAATGVALAAGKLAQLTCYTAGAWQGPVAEA